MFGCDDQLALNGVLSAGNVLTLAGVSRSGSEILMCDQSEQLEKDDDKNDDEYDEEDVTFNYASYLTINNN